MLLALDLLQFVEAVHVHRKRRQNQFFRWPKMAGRGGDHCHEHVNALAVSIEQQKRFVPGGWHERRDVVRVDRLDASVALGDFAVVVPSEYSPIFLIHLRLNRDSRIFYAKHFRLWFVSKRRGFEVEFGCVKFEVHETLNFMAKNDFYTSGKAKKYNNDVNSGKKQAHSKGGPQKAPAKKGAFREGDSF